MITCLVIGVILCFCQPVLILVGIDEQVADNCQLFLRLFLPVYYFMMYSMIQKSVLLAYKKPNKLMHFAPFILAIHIYWNYLFIVDY